MDMKRHLLICFVISMLIGREKEWDDYKMKVVRLGNEVVVFAIIFENVQGQPYGKNSLWNFPHKII